MKLAPTTGAPSYQVGTQPIVGVTVQNAGSVPCVRDLSGPLQVFTVYTASGQRKWSTADCFPGVGKDVRVLDPGEILHYNVRWSGTSSTPGCHSVRTQLPAGNYVLKVSVGTLQATPAKFSLTS